MAKRINRAIEYVVVYKPDGIIIEFDRNSKGDPKPYHTMQSAVKRVKELWGQGRHSEHWIAMTTWKLAEQHQIRL